MRRRTLRSLGLVVVVLLGRGCSQKEARSPIVAKAEQAGAGNLAMASPQAMQQ